jgi:NADH dehydrogenase
MQRIFLTGGTGFVGRQVVRALLAHGFLVRCLVRPGSEADLRGFEAIERFPGDVLRPQGLAPGVEGCAAIVHLVGIIREHRLRGVSFDALHRRATENMLEVARQAGVRRFVHMSALGTRSGARSAYHRTKWAAEEAVRGSGLAWTIFRPSLIYGRGDGFVSLVAQLLRRLPVFPVLGDGRYRLQPVSVEHVAEGFARALVWEGSAGRSYEVVGPTAYPYVDLVDEIARAMGLPPPRKVHAPLGLVKPMTRGLQWLPFYPLTIDQILMLEEESVAEPGPFYADFNLTAEPLAEGLRRMLGPR